MKLFLFDLDGTILKVNDDKMVAIVDKALAKVGLLEEITSEKKFSGRTDHDIFYSFLKNNSEEQFYKLKEAYLQTILSDLMPEHVNLLPGVEETCAWLISNDALWGFLTGNFEQSGMKKVTCSGFPLTCSFGVFGDEHSHRSDLALAGLKKAEIYFKQNFIPRDVVIIGDTPKDIECAKANHFTSVAVSTGSYTKKDLSLFKPDFVLSTLYEFPALANQYF